MAFNSFRPQYKWEALLSMLMPLLSLSFQFLAALPTKLRASVLSWHSAAASASSGLCALLSALSSLPLLLVPLSSHKASVLKVKEVTSASVEKCFLTTICAHVLALATLNLHLYWTKITRPTSIALTARKLQVQATALVVSSRCTTKLTQASPITNLSKTAGIPVLLTAKTATEPSFSTPPSSDKWTVSLELWARWSNNFHAQAFVHLISSGTQNLFRRHHPRPAASTPWLTSLPTGSWSLACAS